MNLDAELTITGSGYITTVEPIEGKLSIYFLTADIAKNMWDKIEPLMKIVRDRAPDDLNIQVVYDLIQSGDTLLSVITDGDELVALNTLQVRTLETGKKVLYIPITSGTRMNEWLHPFLAIAERIAIDRGCTALRGLACRPGWLRALNRDTDNKWNAVHTVIEMNINIDKGNKK